LFEEGPAYFAKCTGAVAVTISENLPRSPPEFRGALARSCHAPTGLDQSNEHVVYFIDS